MSSRRDDAAAEQATVPKIAKRIWGPLTKDESESIGAPAAVASVLLQPRCIPLDLVQKVHSLVPVEVLPSTDVSKKELAARLGKSDYLHPILVLNKGNGSGKQTYVQLNNHWWQALERLPCGHRRHRRAWLELPRMRGFHHGQQYRSHAM